MAVYTQVGAGALTSFLSAYDIGEARALLPIAEGVENSNFKLETSLGHFILTIYEKRVAPTDLPFFLGLMQHLAEHGLPCPLPVRSRDGSLLHALQGKPAAIVSQLGGRSLQRVTVSSCRALGEALARLHLAGSSFPLRRPNDLGLNGWGRLREGCRAKAGEVEPDLDGEIGAELAFLQASWPASLPGGVIHADLFPDNVFFTGQRISGLFDFYFACDDLLAYDLAVCLNAWCFEADFSFNVTKARALLEGYRSTRALDPSEVQALPTLARGAALRFMLTRLYDWLHRVEGALVKPKDPREYLRKLRFHRDVHGPEAYGLEC